LFLSGSRYVRIKSHPDFNAFGNNERTISFWVHPFRQAGAGRYLVGRNAGNNKQWHITVSDTKHYTSELAFGNNERIVDIAKNRWHHLVLTTNSYTGSERAYLNGILVSSKEKHYFPNETFEADILIGRTDRDLVGDPQFTGGIDEMRFYSRAFTADEVKALYEMELDDLVGLDNSVTPNPQGSSGVPAETSSLDDDETGGSISGLLNSIEKSKISIVGVLGGRAWPVCFSPDGEALASGDKFVRSIALPY
jgi:hypothetical protein